MKASELAMELNSFSDVEVFTADGKPIEVVIVNKPLPCGYSEPESEYRDPDTGAHRTAICEGGRLVVRGTGQDSVTNGSMFISARKCPRCPPTTITLR